MGCKILQAADGSQQTATVADKQCPRYERSCWTIRYTTNEKRSCVSL